MAQAALIGALGVAVVAATALLPWMRARRAASRRAQRISQPARRTPRAVPPSRSVAAGAAPVGMHVVRALALDLGRCLTAPPAETLPQPVGGDPKQLTAARAALQEVGERLTARRHLLDALSRSGLDPRELTALIQGDPEIARRVLAHINGPEYQLEAPIEQVSRAAVFLGHTEVRLQAWRACLEDGIRPSSSMTARAFERQWQHAFTVARTAQALCASAGLVRTDTVLTAGLLHDVGKMLALACWPDRARAFDQVRFSGSPALASEIARLGVSHPQLGADLCDALALPAELGRVLLRHHLPSYTPPDADPQQVILATVHVADLLTHASEAHLTGIACPGVYPPAAGWLELLKAQSLDDLLTQNVVLALLDSAVAWRGAPGLNSVA